MLTCCLMCFAAVAHGEEFEKKGLIDIEMKCDNPSGNEIQETKHVPAPQGKAFEKDTVKVVAETGTSSFTDGAGPSGCFMENLDPPRPRHRPSRWGAPVPSARIMC
jgi:hypothetical protein